MNISRDKGEGTDIHNSISAIEKASYGFPVIQRVRRDTVSSRKPVESESTARVNLTRGDIELQPPGIYFPLCVIGHPI